MPWPLHPIRHGLYSTQHEEQNPTPTNHTNPLHLGCGPRVTPGEWGTTATTNLNTLQLTLGFVVPGFGFEGLRVGKLPLIRTVLPRDYSTHLLESLSMTVSLKGNNPTINP